MSEQQQLHHASLYNAVQNNRPPGAPYMYMTQAGSRIDGVGLSQNMYYLPFREQMPQYVIRQPTMYCAYPQPIADLPIANTATEEYGPLGVPHQYPPQVAYPQMIPNTQTFLTNSTQNQRHSGVPSSSVANSTLSRPKRPLLVLNPDTKTAVDLEAVDDKSAQVHTKPVIKVIDTPEFLPPNAKTSPLLEIEIPVECDIADTVVLIDTPVSSPTPPIEDHIVLRDSAILVENGLSAAESCPETEQDSESDSELVIDNVEDDAVKNHKRSYDRAFMLSLKNSPNSRIPLQELEVVSEFYNSRKTNRGYARNTQRVIRLPAGITVKRVEDAFIPSSLRKKENDADPQKVLSRELNVILNRLSDANLPETVDAIKKAKIMTPEDLQLLSNLMFQKAIRQLKYCKVFALLCKELKGFEVQNCEAFDSLIRRQVHELFNTPLETLINELNSNIDAKIAAAKDDDIKKIIEEDRETMIVKKTEAYYGNVSLLAELYLCRLVPPKSMIDCIKKLRDSSAVESASSLLILLKACGMELDVQAKGIVDSCFNKLNNLIKLNKLPSHQVFKIQELTELRSQDWKEIKRNYPTAIQQDSLPRRMEEKPRYSHVPVASETKRKSAQSSNPVTPANLAVTQQTCNSRKLKPTVINWSQGSGQLRKSLAEHGSSSTQPNKAVSHSTVVSRSREASPRMPLTSKHNTDNRNAPGMNSTVAPSLLSEEEYHDILELKSGIARTIVDMLSSTEDDPCTLIEDCDQEEHSALLHKILEVVMDKTSVERGSIGGVFYKCLRKRLIVPDELIFACHQYFSGCDDGWLEDYPFGLKYLGEIFQHLVQEDYQYIDVIVEILKPWYSDYKGSTAFAHCLNLCASRLGPDVVADKFHVLGLNWTKLGVPTTEIISFVNKHDIAFTLDVGHNETRLQELAKLTENLPSTEQIGNFFRKISSSSIPADFVRLATETMISHSKDLSRPDIDQLVLGFGILVDHNSERELQVLHALQKCSQKGLPTDHWQKSLLGRGVISADAFRTLSKSSDGDKNMAKNFHIRNP